MAKIIITICTDNAAFEDTGGSEVARILRELADDYDNEGFHVYKKLRDINGNSVGNTTFKD